MKISEMTNEQAAEALTRLAVPLGNLCEDKQIDTMLKKYQGMKKMPGLQIIGKFLPEVATFALKNHRDDMFEIVGALTMQTKAAAAKMNFVETLKILRESYDDTLKDFFTSYARQTDASESESSPA